MDFVDNGKTLTVDGKVFAKLSPNDRRALMAPVKAARRELLKQSLKEAGITGGEYVNELDAFDQYVFGDGELFKLLQSTEGRAAIIERACRKGNPDESAVAAILDGLSIGLDDDFAFAAKLAGVALIAQPVDAPAEPAPERPSVAGS